MKYIPKKASSCQSDLQPGFNQWNIPSWRTTLGHILCHLLHHPFPLSSRSFRHFSLQAWSWFLRGPTENKQRQPTPPYKEAGYRHQQVLGAKFPTPLGNERRTTRNCTVALATKRSSQQPRLFLLTTPPLWVRGCRFGTSSEKRAFLPSKGPQLLPRMG